MAYLDEERLVRQAEFEISGWVGAGLAEQQSETALTKPPSRWSGLIGAGIMGAFSAVVLWMVGQPADFLDAGLWLLSLACFSAAFTRALIELDLLRWFARREDILPM